MMGKIGLQLYSVREAAEKDLLGTVERVADMGYEGVQFAGFFNTSAKALKKVMDDKGIIAAGSHTGLDALTGDHLEETLQYNVDIGNDLIICPHLSEDMRRTRDDLKKVAETLNDIGQKCQQNGFEFAYHNHDFEFNLFDGERGLDILFDHSDPSLVKVELDCYWATYAGLDPKSIIEKYGDRVVSLHIKDMKEINGQKRSIEIGSGELDIIELLQFGKQHGSRWFVVEQEDFDGDPMESAKLNMSRLEQLMKTNMEGK